MLRLAVVAVLFWAGAALAEELSAPPPPPDPARPGAPRRLTVDLTGGAGFTHNARAWETNFGLQLGAALDFALSPRFSLRLNFDAGFTNVQGIVGTFNDGLSVGAWTAQAFRDVHAALFGAPPRDLGQGVLVLAAATIIYPVLALGFVVAAALMVFSPLGALGYATLTPTVAWGVERAGFWFGAELGTGGAYLHDDRYDEFLPALGPVAGLLVRKGRYGGGARLLWSPFRFNGAGGDVVIASVFGSARF